MPLEGSKCCWLRFLSFGITPEIVSFPLPRRWLETPRKHPKDQRFFQEVFWTPSCPRKALVPQEDALGLLPCCFLLFCCFGSSPEPRPAAGAGLGWAGLSPFLFFHPRELLRARVVPNPATWEPLLSPSPVPEFPGQLWEALGALSPRSTPTAGDVVELHCWYFLFCCLRGSSELLVPNTEPVTTPSAAHPPWSS